MKVLIWFGVATLASVCHSLGSFLVTHFPSFIPAGGTRSGTRSGTTKGMGDVERTEADK